MYAIRTSRGQGLLGEAGLTMPAKMQEVANESGIQRVLLLGSNWLLPLIHCKVHSVSECISFIENVLFPFQHLSLLLSSGRKISFVYLLMNSC